MSHIGSQWGNFFILDLVPCLLLNNAAAPSDSAEGQKKGSSPCQSVPVGAFSQWRPEVDEMGSKFISGSK